MYIIIHLLIVAYVVAKIHTVFITEEVNISIYREGVTAPQNCDTPF